MPTSMLTLTGRLLLTTFGLGLLRPAPGTWGSIPPVLMVGLLWAVGAPGWLVNGLLVLLIIIFSAACIVYGDAGEAHFNSKDPSSVCADETAGQSLTLLALPLTACQTCVVRAASTLVIAFLVFRALDILKPWPARGLQKWPSGWGVLIDDLVVGAMGLVLMQVLTRVVY